MTTKSKIKKLKEITYDIEVGQGEQQILIQNTKGRFGIAWVLKNQGQVLVENRLENNRDYRVYKGDKDQWGFGMKTKVKIKIWVAVNSDVNSNYEQ